MSHTSNSTDFASGVLGSASDGSAVSSVMVGSAVTDSVSSGGGAGSVIAAAPARGFSQQGFRCRQ
ncbi:MAG: hypothetical protein OXC59_00505, partial [Acidimicrobiaceae bacterium]|nr:hypothetical protein [Acidimicrobiaceae bacterium]